MPKTSSRPSARELLGGRWAISLRGWLILSVVTVISAIGIQAQLNVSTPTAAAFTLAFWLLATAMFVAANLSIFRNRRTKPVHIAWLIAFAISIGVVRVAVAFAVPEVRAALGDGWPGAFTAVVSFVPLTVLCVVLVTYLLAVTDWYASERIRLLHFEIDAEAARLRAIGALSAARSVITTRIQTALEGQLSELERAVKVDDARDRLSDVLLDTAVGYVRPESHRLWQERDPALRRGTLADVERASLSAPLPIALPFALWAVVIVPVAMVRFGAGHGMLGALAVLTAMAVLYPLGRAAVRRYTPAPRYIRARLLTLVVMVAAALAGPGTTLLVGANTTLQLQQIMAALVIVVATIAVSWSQAALRAQDARLRSMRSHAEEADFERLALEAATEQMQRELALYLHGTVQAGLVASAYSIQDAANRGDSEALETAIADARSAIAQLGNDDQRAAMVDFAELSQQFDAKWRGMITITWELPGEATTDVALQRVSDVVQECLANASIHGAATEATVRVVVEVDSAIVEVTDDGTGVGDGTPGLGSAVLNEATASQWTITTVPTGGAQVRAVVPV